MMIPLYPFMPRYSFLTCLLLSILWIFSVSSATSSFDLDDSLALYSDMYDDLFGSNPQFPSSMLKTIDPADVVFLLKVSGALALLEEDFFKRTNNINVESILDMAVYNNLIMFTPKKNVFSCGFFYNQTSHVQLTRNNSNVGSYINLADETFLGKVSKIFEEVQSSFGDDFTQVDIPAILTAVARGKIQWRRTGLLFYGIHQWRNWVSRFYLPFYYMERNFFLGDQELDELEAALGIPIDRHVSIFNMDPFVRNYCISDKLGFGDLRISLEKEIFESELYRYIINGGVYTTLPTACALGNGMLGRDFPSPAYLPNINFNQLFDMATDYFNETDPVKKAEISQKSAETMRTIVLDVFDRMAASLLTPQLGNGGHVGVGGFLRTCTPLSIMFKHPTADRILASSKIGLEYLFPAYEKRFFITQKDLPGYLSRTFDNKETAASDLAFIEQELINKLFLLSRKVCVHPGIIFTWTSKLMYEGVHWGWMLGTDTWLRTRESFSKPLMPRCCPPVQPATDALDIDKNKPFMAYRSSIFGGVRYSPGEDHIGDARWIFSLNGDVALSTAGIGEDFSLFLKIEREF